MVSGWYQNAVTRLFINTVCIVSLSLGDIDKKYTYTQIRRTCHVLSTALKVAVPPHLSPLGPCRSSTAPSKVCRGSAINQIRSGIYPSCMAFNLKIGQRAMHCWSPVRTTSPSNEQAGAPACAWQADRSARTAPLAMRISSHRASPPTQSSNPCPVQPPPTVPPRRRSPATQRRRRIPATE